MYLCKATNKKSIHTFQFQKPIITFGEHMLQSLINIYSYLN
jgi:hypothetical protein